MTPARTTYRLATSADFRRCHALARERGEAVRLSWLTVVAERDRELLGFLSTRLDGAVVLGPMILSATAPRPGWLAWRLVEAMENVLMAAGVSVYLFHVAADNTPWARVLAKLDMTPYSTDASGGWYKRVLPRRRAA